MARALFLLVIGFLGNLVSSSSLTNEEQLKSGGGGGITVQDGNRRRGGDIMNLDFLFQNEDKNVLKSANGKHGKDKKEKEKKKKKKHHSSSDSDDGKGKKTEERHSGRTVLPPTPIATTVEDQRIHQQEIAIGRHSNRHISREETDVRDDEAITVRGPIRRKPLIFPNDD